MIEIFEFLDKNVLLHAAHFFLTYREVGELEIALSFPFLQMSWNR